MADNGQFGRTEDQQSLGNPFHYHESLAPLRETFTSLRERDTGLSGSCSQILFLFRAGNSIREPSSFVSERKSSLEPGSFSLKLGA